MIFYPKFFLFLCSFCLPVLLISQKEYKWNQKFSRQDSLRGTLSAARSCYDVKFYDLNVKVDVSRKFIAGTNVIKFVALRDFSLMQIDLFSNMTLKTIQYEDRKVGFRRDGNAIFITLPKQKKGATGSILIEYEGTPTEALNPPWKGGFVWKKDKNGKPWVGVACEGLGASSWWPNKDHLSDEPDSMRIRIAVPDGLYCVSNGNLRSRKSRDDGYADFEWFVSYPINNYNVTLNIADYIRIADTYTASDSSKLELEFYCLPYNFNKANLQFKQVKPMLKAYEHYFGKYPFWNDGYCLVETSYLGMEHQGAIAYGNQYKKGYLGGRIPEGMDWDYIIIHESGHEYFGNSLSCTDHAEMWLHESFTTYMEALYVEYTMGFSEAIRYLESQRNDIFNEDPIVGPLKVNFDNWRGSDSYYKGSWMLHTLRSSINNDPLFFKLLRQFYKSHEHGFATTEDFIALTNKLTQKDFSSFFKQYLFRPEIPVLKYYVKQHKKGAMLFYRWEKVVENFKMPIRVGVAGNYISIVPSNKWQKVYLRNCSKHEMEVPMHLFLIEKEKVIAEPKI